MMVFDNLEKFFSLEKTFDQIRSKLLPESLQIDNLKLRDVVFPVYNTMIFDPYQPIFSEFTKRNLDLLIENKFEHLLMIESLMQANLYFEFILKKLNDSNSLQKSNSSSLEKFIAIKEQFFNINQKRVLYFFNESNVPKTYRKRLLAVSSEKILYIPFKLRDSFEYECFDKLYGKIDVLLQRAPYFYLANDKNKELCLKLEEYLEQKNKQHIKMSSFNIVEKLFFRYNCYNFIKEFIDKSFKILKDKFNMIVDVPFTIKLNFDKETLVFIENYTENSQKNEIDLLLNCQKMINMIKEQMQVFKLDFPVVIKPDECEVHEMFLVLTESGLNQFINCNNFKKIAKLKNFVIQKFINHDGIMFKNFFINKKSYTFIRPSLPNLEGNNLKIDHFKNDFFKFKNEFLYNKEDDSFWNSIENPHEKSASEEANYQFIDFISCLFSEYMNINLFGLDYLFDRVNNKYYLLECNYFPSYRELKDRLQPEYENHIIQYCNNQN